MTLKLRLKDQWDIRTTGRGVAEIEAGEMNVDVLAYKGDPGEAGRDGVPPRFMGDVAVIGDLPDPNTLDPDYDLGKWWGVTGSQDAWFYNGTPTLERRENYIGAPGATGPAPTLTKGTITQGADWGFSIEQVGTTNAYKLNIVAKPGPAGEDSTVPGPTATIETASDFDDTTEPETGDVLVKLSNGKWGPGTVAMSPGVYKKVGSETDWLAVDTGSNWNGEYQTITTLTIPPQPWAYEPDVYGLVEFMVAGNNVRMDLEARLGAVSGPLLGRGAGDAVGLFESEWTARTLVPGADETAPAGAGSTIVPASTTAVIYLLGRRVDSSAKMRFQTRKERAFLRVRPMPVIG
ncbi:hypothetical protein JWS13_39210 [Rhodococcus pseudokoreensis]|uniref:Minor tail protein n=1 Tax=Rhodococcus pseudokoreensis TaxID=2811421 RepID=A0A974WBL5_9NOCA|nr:hypothetical protein [Rhodococcus pseudokoreensis]QSE94205.1 hypothetical protein JWS13_39210 [Rhodococcus pseudokoreensis]